MGKKRKIKTNLAWMRSDFEGFWKSNVRRNFKIGKKCEICGRSSNLTVDHIIKKEFYEDEMDMTNWQVLCNNCHIIKTRYENFILSGGENKVPHNAYIRYKGLLELQKIVTHNVVGGN